MKGRNRLCAATALFLAIASANAADVALVTIADGVGGVLHFSHYQVSGAQTSVQNESEAAVSFKIDKKAAASLGVFTGERVGQQVTLSVCGHIVSRPVIQSPIYGGSLLFFIKDEVAAQPFVAMLQSGRCE